MTSEPEVTRQPEVNNERLLSPPEVTARAEVKKCALLHNGITDLYICVACCTLRLVVMLLVILNNACAWSNIG